MTTANPTEGSHGPGTIVKKADTWFIAMAVLLIVLGILAIVEPGVAGLAITFLIGWLLVFGGGAHLVGAFSGPGHAIWPLLIGIVYVLGGFYFLAHPLLGLGTLTLLLAGIILVEAVFEFSTYFRTRDKREGASSGWLLMNALITLLLGCLIWFHWPSSSVWAIGTLVGVNLLMSGISRLMFGLAARKLAKRAAV